MTNHMMRKMACLVLAAMMMIAAHGAALAEEKAPAATITVQGSAQVSADPDMVTIWTNASQRAGSMAEAQAKIGEVVAQATGKLMELGVLGEDIVTSNYGYYPVYNYESETQNIIGYEANHTLSITCRDVAMLDSVIGVLTDCGLSEIHNVSFDVSTRSELYRQALELAIRAAEEKALTMAAAGGRTITGLISLNENGGYGEGYSINTRADMVKEESAMGTSIRAGGVSVSASVTAVYEAGN